jgi:hypothetical protein
MWPRPTRKIFAVSLSRQRRKRKVAVGKQDAELAARLFPEGLVLAQQLRDLHDEHVHHVHGEVAAGGESTRRRLLDVGQLLPIWNQPAPRRTQLASRPSNPALRVVASRQTPAASRSVARGTPDKSEADNEMPFPAPRRTAARSPRPQPCVDMADVADCVAEEAPAPFRDQVGRSPGLESRQGDRIGQRASAGTRRRASRKGQARGAKVEQLAWPRPHKLPAHATVACSPRPHSCYNPSRRIAWQGLGAGRRCA